MSDLRARAHGAGPQQGGGNALEVRKAETRAALQRMEDQFALALPSGVTPQQLTRDIMTVCSQTPALLTTQRDTLLGAVMTCAQLALRPGVLGQAYVLPFKGRAQFVPGYKGLAQLAHRSGQVAGIDMEIVRRRDKFRVIKGSNARIVHEPGWGRPDDPAELEPVAYYSIVRTIGGGAFTYVMETWEVEAHRDKFALQRDKQTGQIKGPWVQNFDAMALKTTLKYALRPAPMSLELQQAIALDGRIRHDADPRADLSQVAAESVDPADIADDVVHDAELVDDDPTVRPGFGEETFRG